MAQITSLSPPSSHRRSRIANIPLTTLLYVLIVLPLSFYFGTMTGMSVTDPGEQQLGGECVEEGGGGVSSSSTEADLDAIIERMVKIELKKNLSEQKSTTAKKTPRFPQETWSFAKGAAMIKKGDFYKTFDFGNPMEGSVHDRVLLLYNDASLPTANKTFAEAATFDAEGSGGEGVPLAPSAEEATQNCDLMYVHLTTDRDNQGCLALIDDYESHHVQKWLRIDEHRKINHNLPFSHTGRGVLGSKGSNAYPSPDAHYITENWTSLRRYLSHYEGVLAALTPVAQRVAVKNTIVVMTCNFGQSALLVNFACAAKSRGLDVSNVLVFATDQETLDLAKSLGLEGFYDERIFGDLPKNEAKRYMDPIFAAMMYAKVITVQLINSLGYDLVFQDVDIVWYRDPISTFHDATSPYYSFDVVFQDDGAHTARYAPYSANSGFYFVRYNARTRYLFTALLYHGEMILQKKSHQQALTALLSEHSSLFGLKVKTIPLDDPDYPGGFHYHRRKDFMKEVAQEKTVPRLFHMSWTANKDNKLLFMKQMGMWFLKDQCVNKKVADVLTEGLDDFAMTCCSTEPIVSCHYRDKPSKIPCKDSPPIDKGRGSFW